jgi:hypothetical protein
MAIWATAGAPTFGPPPNGLPGAPENLNPALNEVLKHHILEEFVNGVTYPQKFSNARIPVSVKIEILRAIGHFI